MRAPLYYLPTLIAEKKEWALKGAEWGALKEGSLIAMRSILHLLGISQTVEVGQNAKLAPVHTCDCPTNPNPDRRSSLRSGFIFDCDRFDSKDLSDSKVLALITKLMAAGSAAVAHVTDAREKMDHDVKNQTLLDGIEFVSEELRKRIFVKNGWDSKWTELMEKEQKENRIKSERDAVLEAHGLLTSELERP